MMRRSLPVLGAQAIKRQVGDAEAATFLNDRANAVHAAAMALLPRHAALLCPAAVAVHDDGDVPRQFLRIQVFQQACFFAAGRFE